MGTRHAALVCPACRFDALDESSAITPGHPSPEPGDFTICVQCFALLVYTGSDAVSGLRRSTTSDAAAYPKVYGQMLKAQLELRKRKAAYEARV